MTYWQAALLGTIQGLTEFLPVSSSGHLVVAQELLGLHNDSLLFEVVVHLATLSAVLVYFWSDIKKLTKQQYFIIGVGTIPAVLFGVGLKSYIEEAFSSLPIVTGLFLVTAAIVAYGDRLIKNPSLKKHQMSSLDWRQALIIGSWQALAILPGISRSGSTLTGGLSQGLKRDDAFRFSFLLAIPAILGATALQGLDLVTGQASLNGDLPAYLVGSIFAFLFGLLSLRWLRQIIHQTHLTYFSGYLIILSLLLILSQTV